MRSSSLVLEGTWCFSRHLKHSWSHQCASRLNENSNVRCMSFVFRCDEVDSNRLRPHLLRTSDYCWCDKDAINHFAEVQDLTFHRCMALYVQVTYRSMYRDYSVQLIEFTVYHCVTNTIASITIYFNTLRIVFRIIFLFRDLLLLSMWWKSRSFLGGTNCWKQKRVSFTFTYIQCLRMRRENAILEDKQV